jgi:hypothetical protein
MEKEHPSQLELFSKSRVDSDTLAHRPKSFFGGIRNYEKTILVSIGFVITGIISFSLGVEKGKRISLLKTNTSLDIALKVLPKPQPSAERQDIIQQPIQGYTVQVATYQTQSSAQKEVETLKKKGFSPLVLSKSGYAVVCVGSFPDRQKAAASLAELKKRYRDCFLRKL